MRGKEGTGEEEGEGKLEVERGEGRRKKEIGCGKRKEEEEGGEGGDVLNK